MTLNKQGLSFSEMNVMGTLCKGINKVQAEYFISVLKYVLDGGVLR